MTSKEIARELDLSPATVDTYLKRAIATLGASNRRDAARIFETSELSQNLGSQPAPVAGPDEASNLRSSREGPVSRLRNALGLPPIGGEPNELSWKERNYAILRVAAFGIGMIVAIILVAAGILWVFE